MRDQRHHRPDHGRDRRRQPTSGSRTAAVRKGGRAKRKAGVGPPKFQAPQLATLVDEVPTGSGWLHEYKYDGYRLLLATAGGAATAFTRNGHDWSDKFRALVKAASDLPAGCLIDGEAVALGKNGKPDFQLLQATLKGGKADLAFYAFDLLVDRGEDITRLPNIERKERLAALLKAASHPILYGDHVIGKGEALFDAICKEGGEGIISKKASAPYGGTRSRNWLKVKCIQRQEFIIIGWQESDKRRGFRSLHLAVRDGGKLTYAGKVGTGFDTKMIDELSETMRPLEVDKPPLEVPRVGPARVALARAEAGRRSGVHRVHRRWYRFAIRASSRLREDKSAREVVREVPKHLQKAEAKGERPTPMRLVKISSRDRIIYPADGLTKGQLADYYAAVAELMMVDSANRPISLVRCPQGRAKNCFFQKHDAGSFGDAVKHVPVKEKNGGDRGLSLHRRCQGPADPGADGDDRGPRLGQPGEAAGEARPAGVRPRPRRRPRLRRRPLGGGAAEGSARRSGAGQLPDDDRRQGPARRRAAGCQRALAQGHRLRRALRPRHCPGRAGALHRQHPQGGAGRAASSSTGCATSAAPRRSCLIRPAPATAPRSRRRSPGRSWTSIKGGNVFTILDADELLERASSKLLAGWGQAKQKLPKA